MAKKRGRKSNAQKRIEGLAFLIVVMGGIWLFQESVTMLKSAWAWVMDLLSPVINLFS